MLAAARAGLNALGTSCGQPAPSVLDERQGVDDERSTENLPDASIVCGRPRFEDQELDVLLNPTVIVEILSKSTEAYDRGEKFAQYRTLDMLTDYLLLSQDKPRIERFTRQQGGVWLFTESAGLEAVMPIESIQCQLPLAEVYDRVEFDQTPPAPKLSVVKEEAEAYLL